MADPSEEMRPIVRITRWSTTVGLPSRNNHRESNAEQWTIYGVDDEGSERIYVELRNTDEFEAWRASDPLWHEAQRVIFDRLLQNPATRDLVLRINIKAALDAGDTDTVVHLAHHLSPEAWRKLNGEDEA